MNIKITKANESQLKKKPEDESTLGFGRLFTDHMFMMNYSEKEGWHNPRIEPYRNLSLDPAAMVLHYGQGIFEGMKAYRGEDGSVYLFRPHAYFARMKRSAHRLCMPAADADMAIEALKILVDMERDWIPRGEGTSMYIRPTTIATEPQLGVRPSHSYLFYIIVGPVGAYYAEGMNPIRIHVEDNYIRAAQGGLGEAKTVANYASSLLAAEEAKKKGFTQVLWLDAKEKKYVEEVGTMNMFFVIGDEVITAPLTGTVLPGITRDSVIRLVKDRGLKFSERFLSIDEVISAAENGSLKEAFGTGTAAIISPVGWMSYKGVEYTVSDGSMGKLSRELYDEIVGIQYGKIKDPYEWRIKI